jgi:hypothetical protein
MPDPQRANTIDIRLKANGVEHIIADALEEILWAVLIESILFFQ